MERLQNGYTLQIPTGAFPLSTDSMALAAFAKLPKQAKVLDIGSGCGTLGLLLCARYADCAVTGVEIDIAAHEGALDNANRNGLDSRLTSICADMCQIPQLITPGSFHCCLSNPPYYPQEPASKTLPVARQGTNCGLDELFQGAAWALRYGGDFYLVHKPERLAQICATAAAHKLEPKRLLLLRHKAGDPVSLILLQCRKGGKPGLIWEEESLYCADGTPTDYYRTLYHEQEE